MAKSEGAVRRVEVTVEHEPIRTKRSAGQSWRVVSRERESERVGRKGIYAYVYDLDVK